MKQDLLTVCQQLGDEVAEPYTGFVPLRNLLTRFRAKAIFRPLLVEAMFGSLEESNDADWAVLIDSETYSITSAELEAERYSAPLPPRLRNTVAHELVHSISFRREEFGIRFVTGKHKVKAGRTLLQQIEHDTESLSPYVLLPNYALQNAFSPLDDQVSPDYLRSLCRSHGVSPWVLINRLRAIPLSTGPRLSPALRNVGAGLFQKRKGGFSSLLGWPLFTNFDNAITPKFLLDIKRTKSARSTESLPFQEFAMNGGTTSRICVELSAGTPNLPRSHSGQYELRVETGELPTDTPSIFVVRKMD